MRDTAITPASSLNFLPHMDSTRLVEGYRSVLKQIYSCEAYYDRVKLYLNRTQPKPGEWTCEAALAHAKQCARIGHLHSAAGQSSASRRWSYWKFLLTAATRYRRCFGAAMTLAVMGYHFQVMTSRLSESGGSVLSVGHIEVDAAPQSTLSDVSG